MMKETKSYESLLNELDELRTQLMEANDTIDAIRNGQVDALVVKNGDEHHLYTLKSADQTYRVFIEKMKEGAVTLNKDNVILYSNSQFASMVNLPLAKVIGLSFSDFIPENSKQYFNDLMKQGWESDSKGEISLLNKKNELIPFLLSFTSLELDEGKALSIILTDLSHQKETERQLKKNNVQLEEAKLAISKINERLEDLVTARTQELFVSREHFKFLADNIPVIVWTTNAEGKLEYVNRRWIDYTGFDAEQSKTKQQELVHPDDLEESRAAWRKAVKDVTVYEQEFRFKRISDAVYRWHYAKAIPFKDNKGNVIAWIGTSIDIDDQKKELEKKDEFISVASHELRTPLTSLKGYLQLMELQHELPDQTKLYISKGNISINKLQHLINDLLDASKIKAGKLQYDKTRINLTELLNTCIENSNYMYPSFTIQKELEDDLFVNGNAERLEQVVMNLISNAVKYSPHNKKIIICLEKIDGHATVSVIDKGIGMRPTDQKRVFERFYRAEDNKSTPGLGMGLYIADEIVKEHNGHMKVKSKWKEGSVFSFSLPLMK